MSRQYKQTETGQEEKNEKRYTQEKEERGGGRACVGIEILGGFGQEVVIGEV